MNAPSTVISPPATSATHGHGVAVIEPINPASELSPAMLVAAVTSDVTAVVGADKASTAESTMQAPMTACNTASTTRKNGPAIAIAPTSARAAMARADTAGALTSPAAAMGGCPADGPARTTTNQVWVQLVNARPASTTPVMRLSDLRRADFRRADLRRTDVRRRDIR